VKVAKNPSRKNPKMLWACLAAFLLLLAIWIAFASRSHDSVHAGPDATENAGVGPIFREGYAAGKALAVARSNASLRNLTSAEIEAKAMSVPDRKPSSIAERDAFEQGFQTGYRAGRKERVSE
jgi:hypothetical protein